MSHNKLARTSHATPSPHDTTHGDAGIDANVAAAAAMAASLAPAHELLVVDPRVENWQALVDARAPGVDLLVLDPKRDGITQIGEALARLGKSTPSCAEPRPKTPPSPWAARC